ncbi:Uncharacterised protein [Vibrio cholerae]|nr:Uncharacterised protein [Vibrio cholerae]
MHWCRVEWGCCTAISSICAAAGLKFRAIQYLRVNAVKHLPC